METKDSRNTVLSMLVETLEQERFSHFVLNQIYEDPTRAEKEKSFIKRLYSGTLEKLVYLDYVLDCFSSLPVRKMKPLIRNILRMSLYQMCFMDSVPVYTCINEAVKLTRKRGFSNLTGFVNGILRRADREKDGLKLPDHVKACAPLWIYELVRKQYGKETADSFFAAVQKDDPETRIVLVPGNHTAEEILQSLEQDGCVTRALPLAGDSVLGCETCAIRGFSSLTGLKAFQDGDIMVQDPSSVLAARTAFLGAPDPRFIVDVCAAPGGKCLYMARKCPDASVLARDLTSEKIQRIEENKKRLHIHNVTAEVFDALTADPSLTGKADVLIADLPCSGLGVIAGKPDILHRLKEDDLKELQRLQRKILETVQNYVKPGGILVYSTCTVNREENDGNTRWFLDRFPYDLQKEEQYIPGRDPYDGFYIAKFQKRG